MSERKAPYWETPLDLFKLLLTAAAVWAFLGPLGGCAAMSPAVDMPDAALPSAGDLGISAPSFNLPEVDLSSMGDLAGFEIDGLALPGSDVEIFDGDVSLGTVKADADGRWAFALPALAAGAHRIFASGLDAEGEPFETEAWSFELPDLGLSGGDDDADDADGDAGDTDSDADAGDTDSDAAGDAADDADAGAASDEDAAGDSDTDDTGDASVDADAMTVAPVITISETELAPGATITGTAAPGARLMAYDDDTPLGEFLADADGNWSFTLPEGFGAEWVDFRVVAVDEDGNELGEDSSILRILPAGLPKTGRAPLGR